MRDAGMSRRWAEAWSARDPQTVDVGTDVESAASPQLRDVMSTEFVTCPTTGTLNEVARIMCDHGVTEVLVTGAHDQLVGLVTERDVINAVAAGTSASADVTEACGDDVAAISAAGTVAEAATLLGARAATCLPVVDNGRPIGIVQSPHVGQPASLATPARHHDDSIFTPGVKRGLPRGSGRYSRGPASRHAAPDAVADQ